MSVHADRYDEYTQRHNPIWPELEKTLLDHGVLNYSIHLDPTPHTLTPMSSARCERPRGG